VQTKRMEANTERERERERRGGRMARERRQRHDSTDSRDICEILCDEETKITDQE